MPLTTFLSEHVSAREMQLKQDALGGVEPRVNECAGLIQQQKYLVDTKWVGISEGRSNRQKERIGGAMLPDVVD